MKRSYIFFNCLLIIIISQANSLSACNCPGGGGKIKPPSPPPGIENPIASFGGGCGCGGGGGGGSNEIPPDNA